MNQELRELLEKVLSIVDEMHCDQSCACGKCREVSDKIHQQLETDGWRSVNDLEKISRNTLILMYIKSNSHYVEPISIRYVGSVLDLKLEDGEFVMWQPLPEPPKGEKS